MGKRPHFHLHINLPLSRQTQRLERQQNDLNDGFCKLFHEAKIYRFQMLQSVLNTLLRPLSGHGVRFMNRKSGSWRVSFQSHLRRLIDDVSVQVVATISALTRVPGGLGHVRLAVCQATTNGFSPEVMVNEVCWCGFYSLLESYNCPLRSGGNK